MKKIAIKLISLTLALVLVCAQASSALAVVQLPLPATVLYDDGFTKVDYKEVGGDKIFTEYLHNVVVQINTIYADSPNYVHREFPTMEVSPSSSSTSMICISDIVSTAYPFSAEIPEGDTRAGTIRYNRTVNGETQYYAATCSYRETYIGGTMYRVRGEFDTISDVISALGGTVLSFALGATTFWSSFLIGIGFTASAGIASHVICADIACERTDYYWTITDNGDHTNVAHYPGAKYVVIQHDSEILGEVLVEGYVPSHWGNEGFARTVERKLFNYNDGQSIITWAY